MASINYFFALWVTLSWLTSFLVMPFSIPLIALFAQIGMNGPALSMFGLAAVPLAVFAFLIVMWQRKGSLSPVRRKPNTGGRYVFGHCCVAIANLAALAALLPVLTIGMMGYGFAMALVVTQPAYVIGILCIELSRDRSETNAPVA